ncbi:HAMP domain-containing histidine kinase [Methylobacterium sp. BTF04]|nr:HAMP domain-containing sensor histidine kinase [Methylobacterium sp. BTF04]NEU13272.1 HAMP domain-containing histidine kinase [Methylobacterium sp. BTF04]
MALVVAGLGIGLILHRFVRGQVDSRLDSQLVAIAASLRRGPGGVSVGRNLDGPPFDRERAGWYWQVRQGAEAVRSGSLEGRDLALPALPHPGRDDDAPRPADGTGPWGQPLILRILVLPPEGVAGPAILVASAPASALNGPLREAAGVLALVLGLLGLCLMAGTFAQVRLGLKPLDRLRRDLTDIRAGRRTRVPGKQPAEIRPLVTEVNALLDQNAANLERARNHVANLAHGLKTPLATLTLALSDSHRDPDGVLSGLVSAMDRQVRHHLRRARTAALEGGTRERTAITGHVADLRTTFLRLYAEKSLAIDVAIPADLAVACDGQDIDEMLGNLVDNACQWGRTRVRVSGVVTDEGAIVTVEDDGPGLDDAAAAQAIRRGRRLDETVPGNGFGLSITTELAELYGGTLRLDRSPLGGLRAGLVLPV